MIQCKRAYVAAAAKDGHRVLVDRLWPRGIRKDALAIELWLREVAPSTELRQRFGHRPEDFAAFRRDYRAELAAQPTHWWGLLHSAEQGGLTLVYGAHDEQHNNAQVLAEFLEEELERRQSGSSPACYQHLPLD